MNTSPPSVNTVQSVERAAELLKAVASARQPETAPILADRCGLNRSTTWRLLATLERRGLVDRDPETNRYSVGLAVVQMASATRRWLDAPSRCFAASPTRPGKR